MRAQRMDAAWEYLKQHSGTLTLPFPAPGDLRPALLALQHALLEVSALKAELKQAAPFAAQFAPTYKCEVDMEGWCGHGNIVMDNTGPGDVKLDLMQHPTTGAHVRQACLAAGITRIDHHRCGCCNVMVAYLVRDGLLYFDSGCGCSDSDPTLRDWSDAAEWINMQTNPEHKDRLRIAFGLPPLVPPAPAEEST